MFLNSFTVFSILFNSIIVTICIFLFAFFFYKSSLQRKSESKYDDIKKEVELSLMRASFEKQISELNKEMMSNNKRWIDVNSLIISGQKNQENIKGGISDSDSFIESYGINKNDISLIKNQIFVLTPFLDDEKNVFFSIRETCNSLGYRAIRGDETKATGDIMKHIISNILESDLIIANISSRNPNVFFELGIAMALGKKTILISRKENSVPFDLQTKRIIFFANYRELRQNLTVAIHSVS